MLLKRFLKRFLREAAKKSIFFVDIPSPFPRLTGQKVPAGSIVRAGGATALVYILATKLSSEILEPFLYFLFFAYYLNMF